jgi:hypothetical protein
MLVGMLFSFWVTSVHLGKEDSQIAIFFLGTASHLGRLDLIWEVISSIPLSKNII